MITRIILLALLLTGPVFGQTLWQEAKYGMSLEEVRKLFPKSRDDSFMVGKVKVVGPVTDETEISGRHFEVQFYFSAPNDRLDRVILRCSDKLLNDEGAAFARHVVELLQARYGEAKATGDACQSDPRDIDVAWVTKGFVQIRLSFFKDTKLGAGAYRLSITYDGKKLKGAEKL